MKKKKIILQMIAMILTVILMVTGIGLENVSAFWNQDSKFGNQRELVTVAIQLMHCNHSDKNDSLYYKHYDGNGNHLNTTDGDTVIKPFTITPRVNNDTAAGTATYDLNKYIYEYEMSYSEGQQVDYAVITTPNITHFENPSAEGVTETHGRMYWLGEYRNTMENITATTGANEWYSFKEQTGAEVNNELSHQTWESVEAGNGGAYKGEYVVSLDVSNTIDNGQKFLYLLEGTYMNKDIHDSNHPAEQDEGVPAYYGTHVYGLIGIVFYRTVTFDSNGGIVPEGTIRNMKVYTDSNKCKSFVWYNEALKRDWYSDIDVASPQIATPYGTASVKAPSRADYIFTGWYDTPDGGVLIYDTDGNAVKNTKYFDGSGNWIYKGNVTAYANWEYVGNYTIRYDKGASDTYTAPPEDQAVTVGSDAELKDTALTGSGYTVDYAVNTNNGIASTTNVNSETGYFEFAGWNIGGTSYQPGDVYPGSGLSKDTVINASAVYSDYTYALPSVGSANYTFDGWYENYDADTETFSGYAGKAKDEYTLPAAAESYTRTLYAKWVPMDVTLKFDYRLPDAAAKSRLGYILSGADEKKRTLPYMSKIGTLPAPSLTGYRLSDWSWFQDIIVPVDENEKYAKTNGDTAYAVWEPLAYNIKYDYNGGTVSRENPSRAEYYDVLTITAPALKGAQFNGWTITGMDSSPHLIDGTKTTDETASGTGAGRTSSEMIGLNGSEGTVLLTAQWNYASYNIVYDFNGGTAYSGGSYPARASVHEYFDVSNPENGSLIFKGWTVTGMDDGEHDVAGIRTTAATASGAGADKVAGTTVSFSNLRYSSGTVKFTAVWETNERQLTFIADTGMMTGDSIQDSWTVRFIKFGSKNFISKDAYDVSWGTDVPSAKKTGYTFDGFYTELAGGTRVFNGGSSGSIADRLEAGLYRADNGTWIGPSLILYAHFTPLDFNITFRTNGGTWVSDGTSGDRTLGVTYDSEENNSVWGSGDIERTGYIPNGWNTKADGSGYTVYDADGNCTGEGGYWSGNYRKDD